MSRYTNTAAVAQPSTPAADNFADGRCLCSGCSKPILPGQLIRQQAWYKCGELDDLSLGHEECCPEFDNVDVEDEEPLTPYLIACVCEEGDTGCRDCGGKGWFLG